MALQFPPPLGLGLCLDKPGCSAGVVSGRAPSLSPTVLLTLFFPQEVGKGIVHPLVWGEVGVG